MSDNTENTKIIPLSEQEEPSFPEEADAKEIAEKHNKPVVMIFFADDYFFGYSCYGKNGRLHRNASKFAEKIFKKVTIAEVKNELMNNIDPDDPDYKE